MKKQPKEYWKKHKDCKYKYCNNGYTSHYYEFDGSSGVRKEYCDKCWELYRQDYAKLDIKLKYYPNTPEDLI